MAPQLMARKGCPRSLTVVVDGLGEEFLSGTGFSQQEHGGVPQGGDHGHPFDFLNGGTDPDDVLEGKPRVGAGHFIDKLSDPVDFVKDDDDPLHLFGLIENRFSGIQQVNIPGGRVDNNSPGRPARIPVASSAPGPVGRRERFSAVCLPEAYPIGEYGAPDC